MSNGQLHDDQLFQGLRDRLSDYEAPYDGADWDAMNRSLDKLPKTNQFRWKFSLNTIGILLGIAGLSVLGAVIAQGNGKAAAPAENRNAATAPAAAPQSNIPSVTTTVAMMPAAPESATENTAVNASLATGSIPAMNSQKDLTQPRKQTQQQDNQFRLGDQINPLKGFVYETQEDPALLNHHDFKQPEVYYDIDEKTGKTRPIRIRNTSSDSAHEIKPDSLAPQSQNTPEPAAPTEGQRIGFEY